MGLREGQAKIKTAFLADAEVMNEVNMAGGKSGNIFVKYKNDVRAKATVSLGKVEDATDLHQIPVAPLNAIDDRIMEAGFDGLETLGSKSARDAILEGRGDLEILKKAVGADDSIVQVQLFGNIDLSKVDSIIVESKDQARRLRKALDEAGWEEIKLEAAQTHSQLKKIADGDWDTIRDLAPEDIEQLGTPYLDRILKRLRIFDAEGPDGQTIAFTWPEELREASLDVFTTDEFIEQATAVRKRVFLEEFYKLMAKQDKDLLPEAYWEGYEASKAGWVKEVANRDLLKKYPERISIETPPDLELAPYKPKSVEPKNLPDKPEPSATGLADEIEDIPEPDPFSEGGGRPPDFMPEQTHWPDYRPVVPRGIVDEDTMQLDLFAAQDKATEKWIAEGAKDSWEVTIDDLEEAAWKVWGGDTTHVIREALDAERTAIYAATDMEKLRKIIADKEYKNVAATGTSKGGDDAMNRYDFEKSFFGVAEMPVPNPHRLPKYAFMAGREAMDWEGMVGSQYGRMYVKFKNTVRERSTITAGDSLVANSGFGFGGSARAPAAALNAINDTIGQTALKLDFNKGIVAKGDAAARHRLMDGSKNYKDLIKGVSDDTDDFIEVQIYGQLTANDIESIVVDTKSAAREIRKLLDEAGLQHIKIEAAPMNSDLWNLMNGDFIIKNSIGAVDIDNLGPPFLNRLLEGTDIDRALQGVSDYFKEWPDSLKEWSDMYGSGKEMIEKASFREKRKFLREWYRLKELQDEGPLPSEIWAYHKAEKVGWTNDVLHPDLLKTWNKEIPSGPPPLKVQKAVDDIVADVRSWEAEIETPPPKPKPPPKPETPPKPPEIPTEKPPKTPPTEPGKPPVQTAPEAPPPPPKPPETVTPKLPETPDKPPKPAGTVDTGGLPPKPKPPEKPKPKPTEEPSSPPPKPAADISDTKPPPSPEPLEPKPLPAPDKPKPKPIETVDVDDPKPVLKPEEVPDPLQTVDQLVLDMDMDYIYRDNLRSAARELDYETGMKRKHLIDPDTYRAKVKELYGNDVDEIVKDALSVEKTAVYMAVKMKKFDSIVRDGRFKALKELPDADPAIVAGRLEWERNTFGLGKHPTADQTPKYGFLAGRETMDHNDMVGMSYGNVYFRFKDDVRRRSTVTAGDSVVENPRLNEKDPNYLSHRAPAIPLNDVDGRLLDSALRIGDDLMDRGGETARKARERLATGKGDWKDVLRSTEPDLDDWDESRNYLEVQMFGNLGMDDVDAVVVESLADAKRARAMLDANGYKHIKIEAAHTNTDLKDVWGGLRETQLNLRSRDIDLLGDGYIDAIIQGVAKRDPFDIWDEALKNAEVGIEASQDAKRAYLKLFYKELEKGENGGLPETLWRYRKPDKVGFVDDVLNKDLLKEYPDTVPASKPPPIDLDPPKVKPIKPPDHSVQKPPPEPVKPPTAALEEPVAPKPLPEDPKPVIAPEDAPTEVGQLVLDLDLDRVRKHLGGEQAAAMVGKIPGAESGKLPIQEAVIEAFGGKDPTAGIKKALSPERTAVYSSLDFSEFKEMARTGALRTEVQKQIDAGSSSAHWQWDVTAGRIVYGIPEKANVIDNPGLYPVKGFLADAHAMDLHEAIGRKKTVLMEEKVFLRYDQQVRADSTVSIGDPTKIDIKNNLRRSYTVPLNDVTGDLAAASVRIDNADWKIKPNLDTPEAAAARKRIADGSGDYRDLIRGTEKAGSKDSEGLLQVQIFGGAAKMDNVQVAIVETKSMARNVRAELEKAGFDNVRIEASNTHYMLKHIAMEDTRVHYNDAKVGMLRLDVEDVRNLGDWYIDKLARKSRLKLIFEVPEGVMPYTQTKHATWGPNIKAMRGKYKNADTFLANASRAEKRAFVEEFYKLDARGDSNVGLPSSVSSRYDDIRPEAGWTNDVLNRKLLEEYPEELPKTKAPEISDLNEILTDPKVVDDYVDPTEIGPAPESIIRSLEMEKARDRQWELLRKQLETRRDQGVEVPEELLNLNLQTVRKKSDEWWGKDPTEMVKRVTSEENTAVYMMVNEKKFGEILGDNKFKNSIETEKGSFSIIGKERFDKVEKKLWGMPPDSYKDPDRLPKYGFLAGRDNMDWDTMVGFGYGNIAVKFKDAVRKRSTLITGDSFGSITSRGINPPVMATNPGRDLADAVVGVHSQFGGKVLGTPENPRMLKARDKLMRGEGSYKDLLTATGKTEEYLEVGMFGQVTLDDVDSIVVDSIKLAKRLRKKLKEAGYDHIKVGASPFHSRLKSIANGEVNKFTTSLSAKDIDNLGEYYLDKLITTQTVKLFEEYGYDTFPASLLQWKVDYQFDSFNVADAPILKASVAKKRQFLKDWFRNVAQKDKGFMPHWAWAEYKKTYVNWAHDVYNKELLQGYPDVPAVGVDGTG